ncbi:MAG TPA: hypothetical protein VK824_07510 [Planctomycetota bacterium]|nr:hypothetical protein [Planctomycetota bacterium]
MASADDTDEHAEPAAARLVEADDGAHGAEVADGADRAGDVDRAEDAEDAGRPCLLQRFPPFTAVRTTLHAEGLVIQVRRVFRRRSLAVGLDRLVLDPATVVSFRAGLLWTAGGCCAAALLAALLGTPGAPQLLPGLPDGARAALPALAPVLLVAAVLALLGAVASPRRITLFLDREAGSHPSFLRGGPHDAEAADFVALVQRAIVEFRCRPPDAGSGPAPGVPRLASTLDALVAMQREELLTAPEFARFRELALRR